MKYVRSSLLAAGVVAAATLQASAAQSKEIIVGLQCDRTGPTQTVGTFLCPGVHDYVKLINSKGGLTGGHTVKILEIDHEYKVPPGMEAYQRFKAEGAVSVMIYGTPHTQALTPLLNADKIPGTSPGFGSAAAANGLKFPYVFPVAATYWSQGAAAVQFAKEKLGGLKGKKIAYLFYDNPAGREPLPVIHKLAELEGFDLREFAVPPPGVEMKVQVQDIARRYKADFVINHTFGKAPSVSLNEMTRNGFPLNRMVGLVWAGAESNIMGAGGWHKAQGFYVMQFAGAGQKFSILDEIKALYKSEGKKTPREMNTSVYYNRGVLTGALHLKAIDNAIKAKGSGDIVGADVKLGFEQIENFTVGGLLPPMKITAEDHEGGGWVQIFEVKGEGFVPVTEWFQGYRDIVMEMVLAH